MTQDGGPPPTKAITTAAYDRAAGGHDQEAPRLDRGRARGRTARVRRHRAGAVAHPQGNAGAVEARGRAGTVAPARAVRRELPASAGRLLCADGLAATGDEAGEVT